MSIMSLVAWLLLGMVVQIGAATVGSLDYDPADWNITCRYHAYNVLPSALQLSSLATDLIFPLDRQRWVSLHGADWWQACSNSTDSSNSSSGSSGGLPCGLVWNAAGNIDYWEEQGCNDLHMNNCYCYAVGRESNEGYCEPGLGTTGDRNVWAGRLTDCPSIVAAVVDDGGKVASRDDVYNKQPSGTHYIALAVEPPANSADSADYHFWRRDTNGYWSSKPGVTLARNFYYNTTLITDIESQYTRGKYTSFCGYFDVNEATHRLASTGYTWSIIPSRVAAWQAAGLNVSVQPMAPGGWSKEWEALYTPVYFTAGYVEGVPSSNGGLESGNLTRARANKQLGGGQVAVSAHEWLGVDSHRSSPASSMTPYPLTFAGGAGSASTSPRAGPRRLLIRV